MKSFTLIETLVTIFIFALAMGAITGLIVIAYRSYGYTWEQSIAINEAQRGIEIMVREIREARSGDDGSYPIEMAGDKEFIFYSDIDKDGETEKVRYFLGTVGSGTLVQECVTFTDGGSCSVVFSDFLEGDLETAQVVISVEGDFSWSQEYAEVYADGVYLGRVCQTGCSDCAGTWQGTSTFDVADQASDNSIQFMADATWRVNDFCDWEEENHAMRAKFEFSWTETITGAEQELKKGVIKPTDQPVEYPPDQEKIHILSAFVRNAPPVFEYFDVNGNKIEDYPARLVDTKAMKVFLVIDVNLNRPPPAFELESWVQARNLKE